MLNRNHKYIKFLLDKLKTSLYSSGFDISGSDANKALSFLANSDDVLRDIFILARYKNCGSLCSYLLFVYKKLDENSLKYENLPVNIEYDVEYLKRIVIGNFKLNKSAGESQEVLEAEPIQQEVQNQWEVSDEISESKFKVGEIERDIVTEEFSEEEIDISKLKDLNPEDEEKIEEIISVSLEEIEEIKESYNDDREEDAEYLNAKHEELSDGINEPEEPKEEAFDLSDLIESNGSEPKHVQSHLFENENQKEDPEEELDEQTEDKLFTGESVQEIQNEAIDTPESPEEELDEESILEISSEHLETSEEKSEEKPESKEYENRDIIENENTIENSAEIEEEEIESAAGDGKSKKFVEFENKLISVNKEMSLSFDKILALSQNYDENNSIIKDQSETTSKNAFILSRATSEMTFEVISNIYNFIGEYFEKANGTPYEIRQEDLLIFSHSLHVIEKFILEEDFSGIEKTLGDYYNIEKYVREMEEQKKTLDETEEIPGTVDTTSAESVIESFETIAEDETGKNIEQDIQEINDEQPQEKVLFDKSEEPAGENNSKKKLMMILKAEIIELEIIFKSIDEIEGNYKIYEGLRKLSKTYNVLKKMVAVSKRLDMNKLARLSEACYIFIKFIQNYRLSPFDDDIKQIFNYIIYNYKLIALDKPTKDFEEFVFYLNDPVKIFTQKKKNK